MATITLSDGSAQPLPAVEAIAAGNCGTPGVWRFASGAPGPHVAITALIHGTEVGGGNAAGTAVASLVHSARLLVSEAVVAAEQSAQSIVDACLLGVPRLLAALQTANELTQPVTIETGETEFVHHRANIAVSHASGTIV